MLEVTRDANGRITAIVSDGHVMLTGPIRGNVVLEDGSVVDVTPDVIEVDSLAHAAAIDRQIGAHWEANGHPDDVEWDDETQAMVQRPFVYIPTDLEA